MQVLISDVAFPDAVSPKCRLRHLGVTTSHRRRFPETRGPVETCSSDHRIWTKPPSKAGKFRRLQLVTHTNAEGVAAITRHVKLGVTLGNVTEHQVQHLSIELGARFARSSRNTAHTPAFRAQANSVANYPAQHVPSSVLALARTASAQSFGVPYSLPSHR